MKRLPLPRPHAPAGRAPSLCAVAALAMVLAICGCTESNALQGSASSETSSDSAMELAVVTDTASQEAAADAAEKAAATATADEEATVEELYAALDITEDYREQFVHGEKGAEYQKYIVIHDTEGTGDAASVVDWWASNGNLVAAHFVINKDGSIVQCVPLDKIAHHAGYGDTGNNALYDVLDESRDDKLGTVSIGSSYADYGMNSYSIGIELVHVGGEGDYPEAQLEALDALIAYIDAYYGFESQIIDHKAWRSTNSDTSAEFAEYLANYQDHRTHD